jgi:hypothetical protein
MLYHYERDLNPLESVTLLDCIRWLVRSWYHDVLSSTILACFCKSILILNPVQLPIESPDVSPLYNQVQQSERLSNCIDISSFLNPVEEDTLGPNDATNEMSFDTLLEHLIMGASGSSNIYTDDQEDDSPEPPPLPKPREALNAVRLLISYTEGQDVSRTSLLRSLERFERDLESEIIDSLGLRAPSIAGSGVLR